MPDIVVPSGWREKLEEIVGGRRQSWVVAGLVAALVLGALALSGRDAPARVAPPATAGAAAGPATPSASPSAGAPAGSIFVHVAGAVRAPGLYELPLGARVADAIDAAGGPRPKADLDLLNLAEPLVDGAKIDVLQRGQAPAPAALASAPGPAGAGASGAVVNVNSADQAALESIPGIGPAKAAAILDYRSQIGRFDSFEQLLEVPGIGPATLESIRPYIVL